MTKCKDFTKEDILKVFKLKSHNKFCFWNCKNFKSVIFSLEIIISIGDQGIDYPGDFWLFRQIREYGNFKIIIKKWYFV